MIITKFQAVQNLVGGGISGPANGPVSSLVFYDGQTPPTEEAIETKLIELQADYNAKQYQRDRLQEYPDLQECIHAILDDDLTALQVKRKLVKEKYPKPE